MEIEWARFCLALLAGAFLTLAGSLGQLVTNNSLASPSTLGMDGMAVLVVIVTQLLALVFPLPFAHEHVSFGILSLVFVLSTLFLYYKRSSLMVRGGVNIQKFILFGLAFNLLVGAIFSVIQFMFMALNFEFPSALWFGSLKQYELGYLIPFLAIFFVVVMYLKVNVSKLEMLNLGGDFAKGLGINVGGVQLSSLTLSFFLNGVVISYFGVFSFLGLVFPHTIRSFKVFKTNMKRELIWGPIICAFIFAVVDQFCYNNVVYGAELPVGMASSVLGSFFLIFLVLRSKVSY